MRPKDIDRVLMLAKIAADNERDGQTPTIDALNEAAIAAVEAWLREIREANSAKDDRSE